MERLDYKGLAVAVRKHPATGHRDFPKGIYYGTVEGRDCTAPHGDPERALQDALSKLKDGGLVVSLMDGIRGLERSLTGAENAAEICARISTERALLAKVLPLVDREGWLLGSEAKAMAQVE